MAAGTEVRLCRRFSLRHRSRPRGWPGSGGLGARRGLQAAQQRLGAARTAVDRGFPQAPFMFPPLLLPLLPVRALLRLQHSVLTSASGSGEFLRLCSSTGRQLIRMPPMSSSANFWKLCQQIL